MIHLIAQTMPDVNPTSAIVIYGPMGAMLAWFMLRVEKLIGRVEVLAALIDGLTKAMLLDVVSREGIGIHTKEVARDMLGEIEARSKTRTGQRGG